RSRPYHPKTLGKDERLHRTLKAELISRHVWAHFDECQNQFQTWRRLYNSERPHEALGDLPPSRATGPVHVPFLPNYRRLAIPETQLSGWSTMAGGSVFAP